MVENETNYAQEFIHQINNTPNKQPINKKFLLIGGIALVILVIAVLMLIISSAPKPINIRGVLGRTTAVEKMTTTYHKLIDDSGLRGLNSSLSVSLANFNREAETYYQNTTTKEQIKKAGKLRETDLAAVTELLNDSELNNKLDRNYAIQMSYQINLIIMEQEELLGQSTNKNLSALLSQSLEDLKQIQTQFKELTLN